MSDPHDPDRSESFPAPDGDSLHPDLPYGMAGLTIMLERLRDGIDARERAVEGATGDASRVRDEGWSAGRCRLVAEYLLSLASEYWMSGEELAYCRRVLSA